MALEKRLVQDFLMALEKRLLEGLWMQSNCLLDVFLEAF
jgi:hypothetical protein